MSAALPPEPCKDQSEARDLAESIPKCQAFQANCCALHHIQKHLEHLKTLEGNTEAICKNSSKDVLEMNLSQLNTTLGQGTTYYTCQKPQLQLQVQNMDLAYQKIYIWCVLKKYKDIMQLTANLYFKAAV